jgi:tetratricopeptide (TPR) repeat protein
MRYSIVCFSLFICAFCSAQTKTDKALQQKYRELLHAHNTQVDSVYASFFYERGNISLDHFEYESAIADYNKAIQKDPKNYKIYHNRGMAKMERGLTKEAISDFDRTIELMPLSTYAYTKRGTCRITLGDYAGAKQDSSTAIGIDSNSAVAYYNRGVSNCMLGSRDNGCYDLNKAYDLGDEKSLDAIKKYCSK